MGNRNHGCDGLVAYDAGFDDYDCAVVDHNNVGRYHDNHCRAHHDNHCRAYHDNHRCANYNNYGASNNHDHRCAHDGPVDNDHHHGHQRRSRAAQAG